MRRFRKSTLYVTAGVNAFLFGCALAAPSLAQTAPAASAPPAEDAQATVVVTARRIDERLQDVPISITVYNQQQLASRNVTFAADLAAYTPSLSVDNEFGGDNTVFALRGFSQQIQTSPTVGVFFADAVAPRGGPLVRSGDGAGPGDFFDLQNVQVLKGPQGTLFGRNTTGGDVLLVPKKPTGNTEGFLEASAGNYGMEQVQGVFNTPLGDHVRVRLGFDQQTRDGYLKNVSGVGPSNFDNVNFFALRASIVVDVMPNVENYTVAKFSQSDNNGPSGQIFACNGKATAGAAALLGPLACAQLGRTAGDDPYSVENNLANAHDFSQVWQIVNTTTWAATDGLTVKNIMSYAQLESKLRTGIFGDHFVLPSNYGPYGGIAVPFSDVNPPSGLDLADQETFSEELQLQGRSFNDRLTWQAGGYLELSDPAGRTGTDGGTLLDCANVYTQQCFDVLGALSGHQGAVGSSEDKTATILYRNVAGYAQGTYKLTDQLKLTAGIRYTSDYTKGTATDVKYVFPAANTPVVSCNPTSLVLANGCSTEFHQASAKPTWVLDLDYTPIRDILAYAKYSRGYRQGNVNGTGAPAAFQTFQPETVDVYEVGAKTTFHWPVPGTFDFAAFYNDFSNQQLLASFQPTQGAITSGIVNAGKSRISGFEFEATASPIRGLNLDLSYTYLNSKLESQAILTVPGFTVLYGSVPGDRLPFTPANKASLGAVYTLPLDPGLGKISVGANYVYTDATFVTASSPFGTLPAYGLLGFSADWKNVMRRPVDLSFFMTNATNKFYWNNVLGLYSAVGFESRDLGEPRMFGFRLRYHFGD